MRTREGLLQAAAEVFERVGYSGATLEEIVVRADATKGALYFHFRSKAELAAAVVEAHYDAWTRIQEASATWNLNALDTLGRTIQEIGKAFVSSPIARAGVRLGTEHAQIDAELPKPFVGWIDQITKLLRKGQRDGSIAASVKVPAAARVIVASFFGVEQVSARLNNREDLLKRLDEWWAMTRTSLAP